MQFQKGPRAEKRIPINGLPVVHGRLLQGATVETPDGKQIKLATGSGSINRRDVPHAGIKVVGDTPLKLLTVHVVDKGKPLYDAAPKK